MQRKSASLRLGPRTFKAATQDFMYIAQLFMSDNPPSMRKNRIGELIITTANGNLYNLTKILENQPDFEQMVFALTPQQECFALHLLRQITPLYKDKIGSQLSEAEARAIYFYTLDREKCNGKFWIINLFLRKYGKISEIDNEMSLRDILCILIYFTKAVHKLKSTYHENVGTSLLQILYRGEVYDNQFELDAVMQERSSTLTKTESGIFSTTADYDVVIRSFTREMDIHRGVNQHFQVLHMHNHIGAYIADFSNHPNEAEVCFLPFTQFSFEPFHDDDLCHVLPVRSLNGNYPGSYCRDMQSERILLMEAAGKTNELALVDECCQQICCHEAGSMILTYLTCVDYLERIKDPQLLASLSKIANQAFIHIQNQYLLLPDEFLIFHAQAIYQKYLANDFENPDHCSLDLFVKLNDHMIPRPNHGLAFSLRQALYLPVIVALLKPHAIDPHFSNFLSELDQYKLRLLQFVLLFSATGRQSEASFFSQPDIYLSYRKRSYQQFLDYLKTNTDFQLLDSDEIELLALQVKEMGDPNFIKSLRAHKELICGRKDLSKQEVDKQLYEIDCIIFTNHLLNFAHKLDLLRCYIPDDYIAAIEPMLNRLNGLIDDGFERQALPILFDMAQSCILATGNRLLTEYVDGQFKEVYIPYHAAKFPACSTSALETVRACYASTPIFCMIEDHVEIIGNRKTLTPLQTELLNGRMHEAHELLAHFPEFSTNLYIYLTNYEASKYNLKSARVDFKVAQSQLLKLIQNPKKYNITLDDLAILLHFAVRHEDELLIKELAKYKCIIDYPNSFNCTPLDIALTSNNNLTASFLIKAHANIWHISNGENCAITNIIEMKRYELIELLVLMDIKQEKNTAALIFLEAAKLGCDHATEYMLLSGFVRDFNKPIKDGKSLLQLCSMFKGVNGRILQTINNLTNSK